MKKASKLGVLSLSTVLALGTMVPAVSASAPTSTPFVSELEERTAINISSIEQAVVKKDLITKLKQFFPGTFDYLNDNDFHMSSGHRFPNDDESVIRYSLNFHKEVGGHYAYGDISFIGEELHIESFYYQPPNISEALFPGTISKEEAQKIAEKILTKFPDGTEYKLADGPNYYGRNQTLTEPIVYQFSFNRQKNNVSISDQSFHISVLANGEVNTFYRSQVEDNKASYENVEGIIAKEAALEKVQENLSIGLQYQIDYMSDPRDPVINLVYVPRGGAIGIHAHTGKWSTINGLVDEYPKNKELTLLTDQPLSPRSTEISLEEAKAFAEKLLAIDSNDVKLRIEHIDVREDYLGREVIGIQYMYEYRHGGYGTYLELDKKTGEIISYNDVRQDVLNEMGQKNDEKSSMTYEKALQKAVEYLKDYAPSHLHNYSYPIVEGNTNAEYGNYHFMFPRVKDGLIVVGDQLSISVDSRNGSLRSMYVDYRELENWPSVKDAISEKDAKDIYINALDLSLTYVKDQFEEKTNEYQLLYVPSQNEFSFLNAISGKWSNDGEQNKNPKISHPWAEKELNYLVDAGILKVDDFDTFDPNAALTKGKALEMTMKSLTYFYDGYIHVEEGNQSFKNINPDHPLYQIVERAVSAGILKKDKDVFPVDETLTREELAVWYVRALGLERAGKQTSIYQLDFKDANAVGNENKGYVALAHSLGLLTANNDYYFNPQQETTYAQIAISSVRLAKKVAEREPQLFY
ncbi:hypothetical protein GN156_11690 [bacterium LRH843]|nr:hypothetical protein [bacterium LRH843]